MKFNFGNERKVVVAKNEMVNSVAEMSENEDVFLRLLSHNGPIILSECDGSEFLLNGRKTFLTGITFAIENVSIEKSAPTTPKTFVDAYEMLKDFTFKELFDQFETDFSKLCFTEAQVETFCRENSEWIRTNGCATFFLVAYKNFFVIFRIYVDVHGMALIVRDYQAPQIWGGKNKHRLVIPKLESPV